MASITNYHLGMGALVASTPVERVGRGSLSSKARTVILSAIVEGRFEAGRIPPEADLAEMLGVSRTTVRAALQDLAHDGYIARTPGRGTVVRVPEDPFALSLQKMIGFSTLLRESGTDPEVEVQWSKGSDPPEEVARRLALEPNARCYFTRKIFRAGEVVALMLQDVIPETSLKKQLRLDKRYPDSLFEFSEMYCDEPIDSARVELVPQPADQEIADLFGTARRAPYLTLWETHMSRSESPIAFTRIHVNDHFVRFYITRRH